MTYFCSEVCVLDLQGADLLGVTSDHLLELGESSSLVRVHLPLMPLKLLDLNDEALLFLPELS